MKKRKHGNTRESEEAAGGVHSKHSYDKQREKGAQLCTAGDVTGGGVFQEAAQKKKAHKFCLWLCVGITLFVSLRYPWWHEGEERVEEREGGEVAENSVVSLRLFYSRAARVPLPHPLIHTHAHMSTLRFHGISVPTVASSAR